VCAGYRRPPPLWLLLELELCPPPELPEELELLLPPPLLLDEPEE